MAKPSRRRPLRRTVSKPRPTSSSPAGHHCSAIADAILRRELVASHARGSCTLIVQQAKQCRNCRERLAIMCEALHIPQSLAHS